jgi:hypothetical protein
LLLPGCVPARVVEQGCAATIGDAASLWLAALGLSVAAVATIGRAGARDRLHYDKEPHAAADMALWNKVALAGLVLTVPFVVRMLLLAVFA